MFLPTITETSTWSTIKNNSKITEIQHPVNDNIYSKTEFEKDFSTLLSNLNGNTEHPEPYDYLGFYVEVNPLNGCLKFRDEETKSIFIEWAVELGIMPSLTEIKQGETVSEEQLRQELTELSYQDRLDQENSINIQKKKKMQKEKSVSKFYKDYLLLSNIWSGYSKNYEFILNNPESTKKNSFEKKLKSGRKKLLSEYTKLKNNYPDMATFPEFTPEVQEKIKQIDNLINEL